MRIYSRGQRAKRTCWHVHLATAAGVFDSIMKCSVQRRTKKTSLDAAFLLGILPGVLYNDTKVEEQISLRTGNDVCIAGREQRI